VVEQGGGHRTGVRVLVNFLLKRTLSLFFKTRKKRDRKKVALTTTRKRERWGPVAKNRLASNGIGDGGEATSRQIKTRPER